jgi:hypothetical protein
MRVLLLILVLAGCQSGAVVFEPTPLPPDTSPIRYEHPSGAFTLSVPREWAVHAQSQADLAAAHFTPPGATRAVVSASVIRLESDVDTLDLVNEYQASVRRDYGIYVERERQSMADGSWRLIGTRIGPGGLEQALNTFIVKDEDLIGVLETVIDQEPVETLERIVNTFALNPASGLPPTSLSTLTGSSYSDLRVANVHGWRTTQGIFFITGEVVNTSDRFIGGIPIQVALQRQDGAILVDASDRVMGYGLFPGDFAPFSLRYGEGQPPEMTGYRITLGNFGWDPDVTTPEDVIGAGSLTWTNEASISSEGHLIIEGEVINTGSDPVRDPRVMVTVFDNRQRVIAAAFTSLEVTLAPEDSAAYFLRITEMGGQPDLPPMVNVQAILDD